MTNYRLVLRDLAGHEKSSATIKQPKEGISSHWAAEKVSELCWDKKLQIGDRIVIEEGE